MKHVGVLLFAVFCTTNWAMGAENVKGVSMLDGTCVDLHDSARPTASLECVEQLKKDKSEVFNVYRAVPNMVNGQLNGYVLVSSSAKLDKPVRVLKTLRLEKEKQISVKDGTDLQK